MANTPKELQFEDPRFRMTVAGRMLVRIGSLTAYILFLISTVLLLSSNSTGVWLRWLGIFFALVFLDMFLHRREADVPIPELLRRNKINTAQALLPRLTPLLERAFEASAIEANDLALQIARVLLREKEIRAGFVRLDVDPKEVAAKLEEFLGREEAKAAINKEERLATLATILETAFQIAAQNGHRFIGATDIFSALPGNSPLMARLFTVFSVDRGDLERAFILTTASLHQNFFGTLPRHMSGITLPAERGLRQRVMNRAWTSRPTPTLDNYAADWSGAAKSGDIGFMIGHETEYEHMVSILARESNPNALLVGEEGVGKEIVMAHLASKIEDDQVPPQLFDKRLVSLDLARLIAGGSPEELQTRLTTITNEIMLAGNVILIIPDIHNLVKTSGDAYLSAADALLPIIRSNRFPVLGTTYPHEYQEHIEPRSDFAGLFETVDIKEVTIEEAEEVLVYEALLLENYLKVNITFGAIKSAVSLAHKYFRNLALPGSAVDLLKSAASTARQQGEKTVDHAAVIRAAEARINVPLHEATKEENAKLLNLEATIHERLIGQEEAAKVVADALREYRSGLARKGGGPIASFLFVGPTGVGKTELAKILATIQFGSEAAMMRFDMTEYKEKESISRFIGSPDGSTPGALTEAVKKQPYGLILLDEFEKASPDILDLFLQVLDDGRLTASSGQTMSFENTIIIATSNAHSDIINDSLKKGESMASIADYLKTRLTDVFKPELINRFSRIVIFHDLKMEDMQKIAALELKKLGASLEEKGLTLQVGNDVVMAIAKLGYDPAFGARPLRRAIDEHLRAPLAQWLLKENPPRGSEIKVVLEGDKFSFQV
jgi:ATP-dependent Clp protease ATP-binding subunit ClpC